MKNIDIKLRDQHRKLWLWLAQNPNSDRKNWADWQTKEVGAMMKAFYHVQMVGCFACYKGETIDNCGKTCPIQRWVPGKRNRRRIPCCGKGSLFVLWDEATGSEKASYALHIAFAWK